MILKSLKIVVLLSVLSQPVFATSYPIYSDMVEEIRSCDELCEASKEVALRAARIVANHDPYIVVTKREMELMRDNLYELLDNNVDSKTALKYLLISFAFSNADYEISNEVFKKVVGGILYSPNIYPLPDYSRYTSYIARIVSIRDEFKFEDFAYIYEPESLEKAEGVHSIYFLDNFFRGLSATFLYGSKFPDEMMINYSEKILSILDESKEQGIFLEKTEEHVMRAPEVIYYKEKRI